MHAAMIAMVQANADLLAEIDGLKATIVKLQAERGDTPQDAPVTLDEYRARCLGEYWGPRFRARMVGMAGRIARRRCLRLAKIDRGPLRLVSGRVIDTKAVLYPKSLLDEAYKYLSAWFPTAY